jgi:hypothetical protein
MDVYDPSGTKDQRCGRIIRQGTGIVKQYVECSLPGKRAKKG